MSVVTIHPTHLDVHKPDRHSTLCCQMACTMHDVSASHCCTCTVQRRVTQCHYHAAHEALLDLGASGIVQRGSSVCSRGWLGYRSLGSWCKQ